MTRNAPQDELTATLVINIIDSRCGRCGQPTMADATHHNDISGLAAKPGGGCRARFINTRSDYASITAADLTRIRPDLPVQFTREGIPWPTSTSTSPSATSSPRCSAATPPPPNGSPTTSSSGTSAATPNRASCPSSPGRTRPPRSAASNSAGAPLECLAATRGAPHLPPEPAEQEITIMTDEQWEAQNGNLAPDEARARGLCWHCSGKGANWTAFGGEQRKVRCPECRGNGETRP